MRFIVVGILLTLLDAALFSRLKDVFESVEFCRLVTIGVAGNIGWILYSYVYQTKPSLVSLLRYWQVNGAAMLSNLVLFSGLILIGMNISIAFILATLCSALLNYMGFKNWAFNRYSKSRWCSI